MRIAIIASNVPPARRGGTDRYVEWLAESLSARHDTLLLAGSPSTRVRNVRFSTLPNLGPLARDAPAADKIVWHARDQWRPSVHLAVRRQLTRFRPDVVATHDPQGLSAAIFTAVTAVGVPNVHTAHDLNLLCVRVGMTKRGRYCGGRCLECTVQRRVRTTTLKKQLRALICVSDFIREHHVEAGVASREQARTIRLGSQPVEPRLRRGSLEVVRLGYIGAITAHKGVTTLLRAFERAPRHWRLTVAGSGDLEDAAKAADRVDPRITYLGELEGAAKDEFFDSLDLLVIPSEYEEPATLVVVEAAARGLPAVVSDRGGLPEAHEARTFRAGDAESLLAAIHWYVGEPGRLLAASARLIEDHDVFLWRRHADEVELVLAAAADGNPVGQS